MKPSGAQAVMAARREPIDSLDPFPTPPWATRALLYYVIGEIWNNAFCWEPAAGHGIMAAVLAEYFGLVLATDVHDYGALRALHGVGSFIGDGPDSIHRRLPNNKPDWIITNPPYRLGAEFCDKALDLAQTGVALLLRSNWVEGVERWHKIFKKRPPAIVAQFVERVPMVKGRWDPDASTATAYSWFVWRMPNPGVTRLVWIPPCRARLTRADDRQRFAAWSLDRNGTPLLEAGA